MPSSEHVLKKRAGSDSKSDPYQARATSASSEGGVKKGIAVNLHDTSPSLLKPFFSHLPSLTAIPALGGFLPSSPRKSISSLPSDEGLISTWQYEDLDDGRGKSHLLLLSQRQHALQIYRYHPSALPDDPHVQENFHSPEEIFSVSRVPAQEGNSGGKLAEEYVVSARIMGRGDIWSIYGPVAALLTVAVSSSAPVVALSILALNSGKIIKRITVSAGSTGSLAVSKQCIAVSVSQPPSIHLLHPDTLSPLREPIVGLPVNSLTGLPVFALSGRLIAYATNDTPERPGPDGLGGMVNASTSIRSKGSGSGSTVSSSMQTRTISDSPQAAIISTAVDLGGGVARGVWAGLKMGARAAQQARQARLARSAPSEMSGPLEEAELERSIEAESRSLDDSSILGESVSTVEGQSGGEWIKVVDLYRKHPRSCARQDAGRASQTTLGSNAGRLVAHFRSSPHRFQSPVPGSQYQQHIVQSYGTSYLSFNADGTQLLVAPEDGRSVHVYSIQPSADVSGSLGQVWHLYELRRGSTAATVCDAQWSKDGRWVGVATGRGTIHVFPIVPTGGPATSHTHVSSRNTNPQQLYPLSTAVSAAVRLRPPRREDEDDDSTYGPSHFTFLHLRKDPLKPAFCQDVMIFRPAFRQAELARLDLQEAQASPSQQAPGQRRASALTEMMRVKAGYGGVSDLSVKRSLKARWLLPPGTVDEEVFIVSTPNSLKKKQSEASSLSHAEIQTYCTDPRVLPGTIYLSRQIDFFAARAIDEFSPLSIMDIEARTRRLVYRMEVEARAGTPDIKSFDEPLSSALHTVIEAPPSSQIPRLPNGQPGSMWRSIPIRNVAANLGEGVDRVRREYVRAQQNRARRQASEAASNGLSFEEATVFEIRAQEDDEASSPSSAILPSTNTESSVDDSEWGEGWEAEYARAVEDDGAPEELVLGLMDEEEEERRKWALKQKGRIK